MNKILLILATIIMTLGFSTTSSANNSWKNRDQEYQAHTLNNFNYDRELIQQYYSYGKRKSLPPGLAKKKKLPPGLQKQIQKNGKLPPGLQGRYLPYDLERRMERLPRNYVRLRVGADIVLMDIPTKIVLDVIKDI